MLSVIVFLPLAAAVVVAALPRLPARAAVVTGIVVTAADLVLVAILWWGVRTNPPAGLGTGPGSGVSYEQRVRWIPSVGASYHVGVDGLSLPLVALTSGLFLAAMIYTLRQTERTRSLVALLLFVQTTCLGVFTALDLVLFFVWFDLSIVGVYFVIAGWGHADAARAALKFFLYTFLGSLAMLLGFLGLYLAASPHTFDIVDLARANPLAGNRLGGGLILLALFVGLGIKTPVVPFHTWLPPAHTEAPTVGSVILAGVLLKMGTYGFVRVAMPLLPGAWRRYALVIVIVGVVSVVYGALVALAQTDLKRMIAYTSVNHMGYVLLAVGSAGLVAGSDAQARQLAVTGALTQMVSHGLITGALFFLAGMVYDRGGTYEMSAYGGLAARTPALAGMTAVAAFASLGLPGFSGFIAEFQIFTGTLGAVPVATAVALLGILITAALFLLALQRLFLGPLPGRLARVADLHAVEVAAVVPLLGLVVVLGVAPRVLLDVIEPASRALVGLVAR